MGMVGSKQAAKTTTTADTVAADWDNLPPELLPLIAGKLTNICDYIRFRCVCPSWRSAAVPADHKNSFLPWMIGYGSTAISFVNVADGRTHRFYLPDIQGKWIYGSSHGWLVILNPPNPPPGLFGVSLLNPITKAHIPLPALPQCLVLGNRTNVLLCSHPASTQPRQLLVIVWNYYSNTMAMFSHGDDEWAVFNGEPSTIQLGDIAYFGESLYSISPDRRLAVLDIASSTVRYLVDPRPPDIVPNYPDDEWACKHYLDKSVDGDLLLFVRFCKYADKQYVKAVHLFKLDVSSKEGWKWAKVTGDNGGNSFTCHMDSFTPQHGPNSGKLVGSIRRDLVSEIIDNIATGKLHCCQAYIREMWLFPSLH